MSLRLAEAIRIGSKGTEQCFTTLFDNEALSRRMMRDESGSIQVIFKIQKKPVQACTLGAIYIAIGQAEVGTQMDGLRMIFPEFNEFVKCPACLMDEIDLADTIIHLNDMHRWTREAIADWVATQ